MTAVDRVTVVAQPYLPLPGLCLEALGQLRDGVDRRLAADHEDERQSLRRM